MAELKQQSEDLGRQVREEEVRVHEDLASAPQRQAKAAFRSTVSTGNPFILVLIDGCVQPLSPGAGDGKCPRVRKVSPLTLLFLLRLHSSAAPFNEDAIKQGISGGIDMGNRVRCVP